MGVNICQKSAHLVWADSLAFHDLSFMNEVPPYKSIHVLFNNNIPVRMHRLLMVNLLNITMMTTILHQVLKHCFTKTSEMVFSPASITMPL